MKNTTMGLIAAGIWLAFLLTGCGGDDSPLAKHCEQSFACIQNLMKDEKFRPYNSVDECITATTNEQARWTPSQKEAFEQRLTACAGKEACAYYNCVQGLGP
ncbi:MAG: hypothetical protein GMKNLPBB_02283 [Myxococcota bacterium]|nr:hypothetical protein [Myxococcota bacterium]